ncbi:MAG: hypothetical protein VYE42_01510, partial [Actinomycetota bacterium]|nr:hypothetical protein [Actinomycetota bacterium]
MSVQKSQIDRMYVSRCVNVVGPLMVQAITDEMLDTFAIVGPWNEIADRLIDRYQGLAERVISYLTVDDLAANPG